MSALSYHLHPTFVRPVPVTAPAWPERLWDGVVTAWRAHSVLRAHGRILQGMGPAALRDIGMEAEMPLPRHDAGTRLLSQVGPV